MATGLLSLARAGVLDRRDALAQLGEERVLALRAEKQPGSEQRAEALYAALVK